MDVLNRYPETACELKEVGEQSSIQGRLVRQKKDLETRLADVNAALEAMNSNPEVVKLLELVNKVR